MLEGFWWEELLILFGGFREGYMEDMILRRGLEGGRVLISGVGRKMVGMVL